MKPIPNVSVRLSNALDYAFSDAAHRRAMGWEAFFQVPLMHGEKPQLRSIIKAGSDLMRVRNFGSACLNELCEYIETYATDRQKNLWRKKCSKWLKTPNILPYTFKKVIERHI